jgi:hypothetical protein
VLGAQGAGRRHTSGTKLGNPLTDQLGLDRFGVDLLHPLGGRPRIGGGDDLLEQRLRVFVARPQALEIEHSEAAEPAQLDRRGRRHHRVHGGCDQRELERVGIDPPRQRHLFVATGAP